MKKESSEGAWKLKVSTDPAKLIKADSYHLDIDQNVVSIQGSGIYISFTFSLVSPLSITRRKKEKKSEAERRESIYIMCR